VPIVPCGGGQAPVPDRRRPGTTGLARSAGLVSVGAVHGLTQVVVVVDGERFDVSLPSGRPVVEFLADLLALTGRWGGEGHGWVVRPVGATAPVPPPWTLDDADVRDGGILLLERAGGPTVAGDRVVDNLAGTVADVVAERASGLDRSAISAVLAVLGCAALIAPALAAPVAGPTGGVLSALVALVLTILAAAAPPERRGADGTPRRPLVAAVAAPGAALHAALSAWASTDSASPGARLAFALAAGGIVASALAAVVEDRPVRAGLIGAGLSALGGALVAGLSAATSWPTDVVGLIALAGGLLVLSAAGQLGFRSAGVPQLDRVRPTESVVRARVELGRLLVSAFHVTAAVLVVVGAAMVFTGDDPRRWVAAGLVATVVAVRTRACPEFGQLLPLAAAVSGVVVAFVVEVLGPRWGWVSLYPVGVVLGAILITVSYKRPKLRPLVRRRLGRVELILSLACIPVLLVAADILSAAFDAGRQVM
jgi:hypothetical protein